MNLITDFLSIFCQYSTVSCCMSQVILQYLKGIRGTFLSLQPFMLHTVNIDEIGINVVMWKKKRQITVI